MVETWVTYAFIGLFFYFLVNFLLKFVSHENPITVSLILYAAAAFLMLAILARGAEFKITPRSTVIAALIGLFSAVGTVFAIKSINLAPNPGYSAAIYSANFVLVTAASILAFGSPLTAKKNVRHPSNTNRTNPSEHLNDR